jgi:hypothetical protein
MLVFLQIIGRPSVPVVSFQPALKLAPGVDRGSDLLILLLHLFASAQLVVGLAPRLRSRPVRFRIQVNHRSISAREQGLLRHPCPGDMDSPFQKPALVIIKC